MATTLGSAMSGMLARIPTHPIDTFKARLQADSHQIISSSTGSSTSNSLSSSSTSAIQVPKYQNSWQLIKSITMNEGIRGLYRGFGIAFLGSGPAACLYFTSYEVSKRWLLSTNSTGSSSISAIPTSFIHLCSGLIAETFSCVLWVPIDVIKERMQVQGVQSFSTTSSSASSSLSSIRQNPRFYRNTIDAVQKIMRYEGLRGLYRGYGATLASFGPFSALYFVFYEALKSNTLSILYPSTNLSTPPQPTDLPLLWQIITASSAGAIASLVTNPLDLVKLRLQVQRQQLSLSNETNIVSNVTASGNNYQYSNMYHGIKEIIHKEGGIRGLFRGAGARVAFHAPSTAISMTLFEQCRALVERYL